MYPNLNDRSPSQQPVGLQTVDRLHDAAAGGVLNVYGKGLSVDQREMGETNSLHASQDCTGLDSTAPDSERQSPTQQNSTV